MQLFLRIEVLCQHILTNRTYPAGWTSSDSFIWEYLTRILIGALYILISASRFLSPSVAPSFTVALFQILSHSLFTSHPSARQPLQYDMLSVSST
jgi:hypothetical protein